MTGAVLIEFGAAWCGHCQALQPELAEALAEQPDVHHIKVDDGKGKPLGRSFRVKLWPTLVFMRDGQDPTRGGNGHIGRVLVVPDATGRFETVEANSGDGWGNVMASKTSLMPQTPTPSNAMTGNASGLLSRASANWLRSTPRSSGVFFDVPSKM